MKTTKYERRKDFAMMAKIARNTIRDLAAIAATKRERLRTLAADKKKQAPMRGQRGAC